MLRALFVIICLIASSAGASAVQSAGESPARTASATLKDARGQRVGQVTLRETPNGVLLHVELESVEPGVRALHIHDIGRCDGPSFQSAGPHFNPQRRAHGFLASPGPHAGDLPNLYVPETGTSSVDVLAPGGSLTGGQAPTLLDGNGAAVVLHAGADDYKSDPAGSAGDRVACGVITR